MRSLITKNVTYPIPAKLVVVGIASCFPKHHTTTSFNFWAARMDQFIDELAASETREELLDLVRQAKSKDDFLGTMRNLRQRGKLNAYSSTRRPLRIDEEDCLTVISSAVFHHLKNTITPQ